jgi:ABC-type glutathione transport system ATPase component
MNHLKHILTRYRIGILYISHHLKRVRALADVVSIMNHGQIVYQAPIEQFAIDDREPFPNDPKPYEK